MSSLGEILHRDRREEPPTIRQALFDEQIGIYKDAQPGFKEAFESYLALLSVDLPPFDSLLGIEIEAEQMAAHIGNFGPRMWSVKADGSLRDGGIEFISRALPRDQIIPSIAALYAWIDSHKLTPDYSWRTSVHVHFDVMQMDVEDFKKFVLLYLVFENTLFEFANADRREQNIFCTPLTRTDPTAFAHLFRANAARSVSAAIERITRTIHKYSALNFMHLWDFGTLEFRHIRGDRNPKQLMDWICLCMKLLESSKTMSKKEVLDNISELNTTSDYRQFCFSVFGPRLSDLLVLPRYEKRLEEGIIAAKQAIAYNPRERHKADPKSGLAKFVEIEAKKLQADPLQNKRKSAIPIPEELQLLDEEEDQQDEPQEPEQFEEAQIEGRRFFWETGTIAQQAEEAAALTGRIGPADPAPQQIRPAVGRAAQLNRVQAARREQEEHINRLMQEIQRRQRNNV